MQASSACDNGEQGWAESAVALAHTAQVIVLEAAPLEEVSCCEVIPVLPQRCVAAPGIYLCVWLMLEEASAHAATRPMLRQFISGRCVARACESATRYARAHTFMSCSHWRSRVAEWCRSSTRGSVVSMPFMLPSSNLSHSHAVSTSAAPASQTTERVGHQHHVVAKVAKLPPRQTDQSLQQPSTAPARVM